LIEISPNDIKFVSIVLLPQFAKKNSIYQYIVYRIQIYGFCQLFKVLSIYFSRKMLDTIFGRTYSISRVAKKNGIEIVFE